MAGTMPPLPNNVTYQLKQFPPDQDGLHRCELTVNLPNGRVEVFPGEGSTPAGAWINPHLQASMKINMMASGVDDTLDVAMDDSSDDQLASLPLHASMATPSPQSADEADHDDEDAIHTDKIDRRKRASLTTVQSPREQIPAVSEKQSRDSPSATICHRPTVPAPPVQTRQKHAPRVAARHQAFHSEDDSKQRMRRTLDLRKEVQKSLKLARRDRHSSPTQNPSEIVNTPPNSTNLTTNAQHHMSSLDSSSCDDVPLAETKRRRASQGRRPSLDSTPDKLKQQVGGNEQHDKRRIEKQLEDNSSDEITSKHGPPTVLAFSEARGQPKLRDLDNDTAHVSSRKAKGQKGQSPQFQNQSSSASKSAPTGTKGTHTDQSSRAGRRHSLPLEKGKNTPQGVRNTSGGKVDPPQAGGRLSCHDLASKILGVLSIKREPEGKGGAKPKDHQEAKNPDDKVQPETTPMLNKESKRPRDSRPGHGMKGRSSRSAFRKAQKMKRAASKIGASPAPHQESFGSGNVTAEKEEPSVSVKKSSASAVNQWPHVSKKDGIEKSAKSTKRIRPKVPSMGNKPEHSQNVPRRQSENLDSNAPNNQPWVAMPSVSFAPAKNQTPERTEMDQEQEEGQLDENVSNGRNSGEDQQFNASSMQQNPFMSANMGMPGQDHAQSFMNPMAMAPGMPYMNPGADMMHMHAMNGMVPNHSNAFAQMPQIPMNPSMIMNTNGGGAMMPMNGLFPMNPMNGMNYMGFINPMNPMLSVNGMMGQYPFPNFNGMAGGMPPNLHEQHHVDRIQRPQGPAAVQPERVVELESVPNPNFSPPLDSPVNLKRQKNIANNNSDLEPEWKAGRGRDKPNGARGRKGLNAENDPARHLEKGGSQGADVHRGGVPIVADKERMVASSDMQSDEESDGEDYVSQLHLVCQKDIICPRPKFNTKQCTIDYYRPVWECAASVKLPKGKFKEEFLAKRVTARNVKKARQKVSKELLLALKDLISRKEEHAAAKSSVVEPPVANNSTSIALSTPATPVREKHLGISNCVAALLQLFHWNVLSQKPEYDYEELGGRAQGQWRCTVILTVLGAGVEKVFYDAPQKRIAKLGAAQKGLERMRELDIPEVKCFDHVKESISSQKYVDEMPKPVSPTFAKSVVQMSDEESGDEEFEEVEELENILLLPKQFKVIIPLSDEECDRWIDEHVEPGCHLGLFCDSWSARVSFGTVEKMSRESQEIKSPQFPLICLSTNTSAMVLRGGNMFVTEKDGESAKGMSGFWIPQRLAEVLADHRVLKHGHSLDQGLLMLRAKYEIYARGVNDIAVTSFAVCGHGGVAGNRILCSLGHLAGHWLKKDMPAITGRGIWSCNTDAPKEMVEAKADGLATAALSAYACLRIRERMVAFSDMKCSQNFSAVTPQFDELCSRLLKFH